MTGHPEIDAMLERAAAYRREVYARLGQPPMTCLVTEREYDLLLCFEGHGLTRDEDVAQGHLQLFGMRVVKPEHRPWDGNNVFMEHVKQSPLAGEPVQRGVPLPSLPDALISCRTERPPQDRDEVGCPCGEVIWDLSPLEVARLRSIRVRVERQLAAAFVVPADLFGPSPGLDEVPDVRPPMVNSETSSLEEWEAAVHTMIADVKQRRVAASGNDFS